MDERAAIALVALVFLGLLSLTCWALLWIWAKREGGQYLWELEIDQFLLDHAKYQCRSGDLVLSAPWLAVEPFSGDLAWPEQPRAIYDQEVDGK